MTDPAAPYGIDDHNASLERALQQALDRTASYNTTLGARVAALEAQGPRSIEASTRSFNDMIRRSAQRRSFSAPVSDVAPDPNPKTVRETAMNARMNDLFRGR